MKSIRGISFQAGPGDNIWVFDKNPSDGKFIPRLAKVILVVAGLHSGRYIWLDDGRVIYEDARDTTADNMWFFTEQDAKNFLSGYDLLSEKS